MRREERERLERPYDEGPDDLEARLPRRLGVHVPRAQMLAGLILADFDESKYGVGWWAPHPGTKRRILISDYLWQAINSIQTNLVEAALHLWEARSAWESLNARFANVPKWTPTGEPRPEIPPIDSPIDELPATLAALHVAGFFRGIGSAVDCLSAAIVGVAGLKTNILKADIGKARRAFKKLTGADQREQRQLGLAALLEAVVDAEGPKGWLDWATDYRNMLVHRARRTSVNYLQLPPPVLLDAAERPIVRARSVPLLDVDPDRSEIEVLLHHHLQQHIEEEGGHVLDAVLASTRELVEKVAAELESLWIERRNNPSMIEQPREQWPDVTAPDTTFAGYSPKSFPVSMNTLVASPSLEKRIKAAALTTAQRAAWEKFD